MTARHDTIWQDALVAANYGVSRTAIPFVDMHFEVMHRLIDAAGIEVRNVLDLGAGDGIATAEIGRKQPLQAATLTDFSNPMLDGARERFAGSELDLQFVTGLSGIRLARNGDGSRPVRSRREPVCDSPHS